VSHAANKCGHFQQGLLKIIDKEAMIGGEGFCPVGLNGLGEERKFLLSGEEVRV